MEFEVKDFYDIDDLLKIVEILRNKDYGCDWDKVQTHRTIRQNFIEEAYEAADAIDNRDADGLKEELGDVLLQVLLHCQMEKEEGSFDFSRVVDSLAKKLVLRHPHVFKGEKIEGADRVLARWEEIKNESHEYDTVSRTVNAVPKSFPSLLYTQKIQKRVAAGNFPLPDTREEIDNINKLFALFTEEPERDKKERISGRILFSVVNALRQGKVDCEEALRLTDKQFVKIFNDFEKLALQKGLTFDIMDLVTIEELWNQAERA